MVDAECCTYEGHLLKKKRGQRDGILSAVVGLCPPPEEE